MTSEEFYELAINAVKRKKFDQARDYFLKSLAKDPENIESRKGLHVLALSQFDGKATKALLSGWPILAKLFMAKMQKKYDEGLILGEEFLCKNPKHKWTLQQMLEFSEAKEYKKSVCFYHIVLAESCPEDASVVVDAADYLSMEGSAENFDKAVAMMTQLCNVYPDDADLSSDRNRVEARRVTQNLENAKNQSDVLKDKDAAKTLEAESQQIKTADDLEAAIIRAQSRDIKENSARSKEVLADLLFRKGDVLQSIELLEASIVLDPNNQSVYSRLGDAKIKFLADQLTHIEDREKTGGLVGVELQDLKERIKEKRRELQESKFNEYNRRLKVNPNDMKTRYELGVLSFKAKEFDQAIQQFQKAVQDARLSFRSSQYLGHCYKYKGLFDMAIREFDNAAKKPGANASERMGVLYEAADCYEKAGKLPEALDLFKSILEKDFGFKDVVSKVEALQKKIS